MRYNKTIIAALIATFALTGCGNSVPSTEAPKTEPTTVVTTEQATEPTTKAAEEVKAESAEKTAPDKAVSAKKPAAGPASEQETGGQD